MRPSSFSLPRRTRALVSPGRLPAGLFTLGLVLAGCLLLRPPNATAGTPDTLRFRTLSVVDPEGTGGEAFRILVPDGWTFSGGIQWMPDTPGLPATAAFQMSAPDGKTAFQVFPSQPFFWTNIQKILSEHPRGSRYYGREVRPVMQPVEALKKIVIPMFRPGVGRIEVKEERPLPGLAADLGAGILTQRDTKATGWGGTVRIQYTQDGIQIQERMYGVVQQILFNFASPTGTQTTLMWNAGYLVSFRWEAVARETRAAVLQTVASSFRWNPEWFNSYSRLVAYMMVRQVERLEDRERMRRILRHGGAEISEDVMGYYREHQQVYTRMAKEFASGAGWVEPYHNPLNGENVDLPSGFRGAWANPEGEYVLSRNPSFEPAPGPEGQTWTRIRPASVR